MLPSKFLENKWTESRDDFVLSIFGDNITGTESKPVKVLNYNYYLNLLQIQFVFITDIYIYSFQ